MLSVADCLYTTDPDSVRAIVLTEPASRSQKAAYTKLIPEIGSCIPKDVKLAFSRIVIEGAFGEYLYRSLVPKVQNAAGKPN
jgi:hypothetical protein